MICKSLKDTYSLVFQIRHAFRLIGFHGPSAISELLDIFLRIEPFITTSSKRVILVGNWDAVLDPKIDRRWGGRQDTYKLDAKSFRKFVERLNFVDKFRKKHPSKVEWTWTARRTSCQFLSYLDRILVRRRLRFFGRLKAMITDN